MCTNPGPGKDAEFKVGQSRLRKVGKEAVDLLMARDNRDMTSRPSNRKKSRHSDPVPLHTINVFSGGLT